MNIEFYRSYCLSKKGVTESFPFPNLANLLVFKVADKMFTATDVNTFEDISVRCKLEQIDELRAKYSAVREHRYFKRGWNLVEMNTIIPDKIILEWIDVSYSLALDTLNAKARLNLKS